MSTFNFDNTFIYIIYTFLRQRSLTPANCESTSETHSWNAETFCRVRQSPRQLKVDVTLGVLVQYRAAVLLRCHRGGLKSITGIRARLAASLLAPRRSETQPPSHPPTCTLMTDSQSESDTHTCTIYITVTWSCMTFHQLSPTRTLFYSDVQLCEMHPTWHCQMESPVSEIKIHCTFREHITPHNVRKLTEPFGVPPGLCMEGLKNACLWSFFW